MTTNVVVLKPNAQDICENVLELRELIKPWLQGLLLRIDKEAVKKPNIGVDLNMLFSKTGPREEECDDGKMMYDITRFLQRQFYRGHELVIGNYEALGEHSELHGMFPGPTSDRSKSVTASTALTIVWNIPMEVGKEIKQVPFTFKLVMEYIVKTGTITSVQLQLTHKQGIA